MFGHYPRTINRAALIVRPKQAYVDWANSIDDDEPRADLRQLREEPSIYLAKEIDDLDDVAGLVADYWERVFQEQLNSWMRDPESWLKKRTYEMFLDWFDCEVSTIVWDLLKGRSNRGSDSD